MRIDVLGPLQLRTDGGEPIEIAERKLRLLLASLVGADGAPVTADTLIDRLWGSHLPADPPKVLRSKLSHLRTVLNKAEADGRHRLKHTPAGYQLTLDPDTVDASRFKSSLGRARQLASPAQQATELRQTLSLWRGEPYGDLADEVWLAPVTTELKSARGDAIELLVDTLAEDGRPEQAIDAASKAVSTYPTRERLVAAFMRALYQVGRQDEALGAFEALRQHLSAELGVDPGPQIRDLHERILRQDPALSAPQPAADAVTRPGRAARSNLPAETAPLIGRRHESEQLAALLTDSRLVTLTGIGGVGKTRLALHHAHRQPADAENGAWFIDLTELSRLPQQKSATGERVASLTVGVLDLPERDTTISDIDRVAGALGTQSGLLVLDNCEHIVDEAAVFVSELLTKTPGVHILATSREPLGLVAEQRFDVSTLNTEPEAGQTVSEAAEFFAVRARASEPGFELDESTVEVVAQLCRRLDGLPLALELAAARIRGISVADLLERLSDRLNLLQRPGRGAPRRQQTLRGMIDWSWSLLDESEQIVLRRLAVQPGSFTLRAAEKICADDSPQGAPVATPGRAVKSGQLADILIRLVDRSMVQTTSTSAGMRYGLLESVATFAAEKLVDAGEGETVARRHLEHYLDLACEVDNRLRGPEQRRWLALLDAERTQLRNAFEEATRLGDGASAVRLTVATFWYHWVAGRQAHLREDLRTAINLPGPRDDSYAAAVTFEVCMSLSDQPGREAELVAGALARFSGNGVARARVQYFAGTSLLALGVRAAGERHIDEAIDVLAEAGEDWDVAVAVSQRDWFLVGTWLDSPRGMPDGRDPETVLRDLGDGYGLAQWLSVEHRTAEVLGDYHRAADAADRALRISLDFGLWGEASDFLGATALAALRTGNVPVALDRLAQARALAWDVAYEYGSLTADFVAAMISRYQGDLQGAHVALERWITSGGLDATRRASTHIERGFLAVQQADPARAQEALDTARDLMPAAPDALVRASVLELAAAVRALDGDITAAELLGAAAAHRERAGVTPSAPARQDIDWVRTRLAEHLPEDQVTAAVERARGVETDLQLQAITAVFTAR